MGERRETENAGISYGSNCVVGFTGLIKFFSVAETLGNVLLTRRRAVGLAKWEEEEDEAVDGGGAANTR